MGLGRFFRRKHQRVAAQQSVLVPECHPELLPLRKALNQRQFQHVLNLGAEALKHPDATARTDASRVLGVASMQLNDYEAAYQHSSTVVRSGSEWFLDWFNLCTTAILAGHIETGKEAFERAYQIRVELETDERPAPGEVKYYFARALIDAGQRELGLNQLRELAVWYGEMTVTDDHVLWMRGMPFFSDFCKGVLLGCGDDVHKARDWIRELYDQVDSEGQDTIRRVIG